VPHHILSGSVLQHAGLQMFCQEHPCQQDASCCLFAPPPAGTLANKACNGIHWSPAGHNIVLSGLKSLNGQLEFFNVDEFEVLAAVEHFMATDVEWDPTGRYVASSVTSIHQMENGFIVWSFHGKQLYT